MSGSRDKKPAPEGSDRQDEARNLAQEAVEEAKHGNKDEASFLAGEARALDKTEATRVLGNKGGSK